MKKTLIFALFAGFALTGFAQENAELVEEDIINLEPFVIFAGEMDVIDGITGKEYNGTNAVVWGFVDTFKEYLIRYHEKLKEAIEEVSGIPFEKYYKGAKAAQVRMMENYRD